MLPSRYSSGGGYPRGWPHYVEAPVESADLATVGRVSTPFFSPIRPALASCLEPLCELTQPPNHHPIVELDSARAAESERT